MSSALLDTMSQQVATQCDGNRESARIEAEAIGAQARSESSALRDSVLSATKSEMDSLTERWKLKAEAEAARAELVVQNVAVEDVLDKVRANTRALVENAEFGAILEALLAEVMEVAPEDIIVLAPEAHVDKVKTWLEAKGKGSVTVTASSAMWDGVAVQDAQQTFRISNTLSGRFSRVQSSARSLCMTTMFRPSENGGA